MDLQLIRELLPPPGTELMEYTFLPPDGLWTGEIDGIPFTAVAEDRWPSGGGMFLLVRSDGPVYLADLEDCCYSAYCAASFPQFLQMKDLFFEALEDLPGSEDGSCADAERLLREKVRQIDPTVLEDENSFWSLWLEELSYGL